MGSQQAGVPSQLPGSPRAQPAAGAKPLGEGGSAPVLVALLLGATAAASSWAGEDYLTAGKWADEGGNYICVPPGNHPPEQALIEAQIASESSTGDGRYIGECKATRCKVHPHSFEARLDCSEQSIQHAITDRFVVVASGALEGTDNYTVKVGKPGEVPETSTYKRVAVDCKLDPKATAVGPNPSITQPLSMYLQFLEGFPSEASTAMR